MDIQDHLKLLYILGNKPPRWVYIFFKMEGGLLNCEKGELILEFKNGGGLKCDGAYFPKYRVYYIEFILLRQNPYKYLVKHIPTPLKL